MERYPNGGALVAHAYHAELGELTAAEQEEFADLFLELVYGEESEGVAHCVMGIVHDAAKPMDDFIDYFCDKVNHWILNLLVNISNYSILIHFFCCPFTNSFIFISFILYHRTYILYILTVKPIDRLTTVISAFPLPL